MTALHFACKKGHINIVKFLIENGAEINAKTDTLRALSHYIYSMI